MAKEFYQLIRSFGGLSLEYTSIQESDFSDTAGTAYTPPERGEFRRIDVDRSIQLLQDCPGVVETFQTTVGSIHLPANTFSESTNDAGNGRVFYLKNSGSSSILIKDYLGNTLYTLNKNKYVQILSNNNNLWDFYDSNQTKFNGLEPSTSFTVTYSETNRTFTVTCAEDAVAWVDGVGYICTTETTTAHADVSGKYYLYYNSSGTLTVSTVVWDLKETAPVSFVYYNATLKKAILFEERHPGNTGMSDATHENLHLTQGTKVISGFDISGYTLEAGGASNLSYAIASGVLADEDLYTTMPILLKGGPYRVLYRSGSSGEWFWDDTSVTGILDDGTDIYFNEFTGSTWQLTPIITENYFVNYYVFIAPTTSGYLGTFSLMGQISYPTLSTATEENPLVSVLGFKEFTTEGVYVYRLTYKRLSGNTPSNTQLVSVLPVNTNLVTKVIDSQSGELFYRVVFNENQLLQAMIELNDLGGGAIQFAGQVNLTQNRTFSFGNIRWIGATSNNSALKLNGYVITIGGGIPSGSGGAYFQNMRFLGENSGATGFNQQLFNTDSTESPLFIYFDNCFFKNIMSRDTATYADISGGLPNGVVCDVRNGATSLVFENCDFHSDTISDTSTTLRHAPITIWTSQGRTTRVNALGSYTPYTGRNRYQLLSPAGSPSAATQIFFSSDGTSIHFGDLPTVSSGTLSQYYLIKPDAKRKYTIQNGGTTSLDIPDANNVSDGLWVINATATAVSFTLPLVNTSGSGFNFTLRKDGTNNCTILPNTGQTIEGQTSCIISGINNFTKIYYDGENKNWLIERSPWEQQASDDGLSTTTSTTFQQKLRLTTPILDIGVYKIEWGYNWGYSDGSQDFIARVQVNDTVTIMQHQQEPKDTGANQLHPVSGFGYVSLTGQTSLNIDLDYRSEGAGDTSRISQARLNIRRVDYT